MSWEVVPNLRQMTPLPLIIRNVCLQCNAPEEVIEKVQDVYDVLKETLSIFAI